MYTQLHRGLVELNITGNSDEGYWTVDFGGDEEEIVEIDCLPGLQLREPMWQDL